MVAVAYEALMQPGGPDLCTLGDLIAAVDPAAWWKADAACRDEPQGTFFLSKGESAAPARAICDGCLVRSECLDYALEVDAVGVWAGTSDRERRGLDRRAS